MWGLTGVTLADGLGGEEEVAGSQGGVGRAVGGTVGGHGEGDDEEREGGVGKKVRRREDARDVSGDDLL